MTGRDDLIRGALGDAARARRAVPAETHPAPGALHSIAMTLQARVAAWLARADPANAARASAAWEDTLRAQADLWIEFPWSRDDGARSWVNLQATAIRPSKA